MDDDGYAYSAGCTDDGQLGVIHYDFNPKNCSIPYVNLSVFSKMNPGKKVSAGDGYSLFLDSSGVVFTCGKANFGRLGQGHLYSLNTPTAIGWFIKNKIPLKDVNAGGRHCLALSNEQVPQLYGWGFGFYYQLGLKDDQEDHLNPVKIQIIEPEIVRDEATGSERVVTRQPGVKSITCGYFHSGVILKKKKVESYAKR
jgi:alpha-tubulin suppressor-like RCC1 family protein